MKHSLPVSGIPPDALLDLICQHKALRVRQLHLWFAGQQAAVDYLLRRLSLAGRRYRGVARKGVKAIEMQILGYSTQEIAALYGVRSNVVAAWVSRARQMLKSEYMMTAE